METKRMGKRFVALLLSLVMLLGSLPVLAVGTSGRSEPAEKKQILKAYAEKVYGIVQDYGISDSTRFDGAYGLAAAEMLDFNGDGTDELVLVWGADGNICSGIYTYSGGSVRSLWETKADGFSGIYNVFINQNGNATYMAYGETRHFYSPVLVCVDGRYVKSNGTWTQEDEDRVYAAAMEGGLMGEGDMRFTIALEKYGVTDNYATREYLWSYGCEGIFYKYDSVDKTLERLAPYAEGVQRAAAILGNIAYIGDRSKCRMTVEMAKAYADVIESLPATESTEWSSGTLYAALADVAGDGLPILVTAYLDKNVDPYEAEWCDTAKYGYFQSVRFWGYRDGAAYDAQVKETLDYGNGFGRMNGKGVIFVKEFIHEAGHELYNWYYTVSGGEIRLERTIVTYSACMGVEPGVAEGEAPPNASYRIDSWHVDSTQLVANGWVEVNDGYDRKNWYLVYDNGVNVTEQAIDAYGYPDVDSMVSITNVEEIAHINDGESHFNHDTTAASTAVSVLRTYAEASSPSYTFPKVTEDTDDYVSAIAKAAAEVVGGEVTAIYKLADGVYYVIITVNGSEKAAVVKGVKENGKIVWRVDKKHDTPLAPEELSSFAYDFSGKSNITLDYSQLQGEKDTESIKTYLKELLDNMDGITPNDPAKGELAAFLESAMAVLGTGQVTGKDNRLTLDSGTVSDLVQAAKEVKEELEVVLDDNDVTLNKALTIMIRIVWQNMDSGEPCQVALDEELVQALSNCTMQMLLGDGQHYLQISGTNLKKLVASHGMIYVQMSKVKDGVYTINFLDKDEKVLEQIDMPITVALPSVSELNTIMVSYTGGSDNWGGQYDRNTQVITFDARYSGQYEVLENSVDINDITELDEESRQAIAFLVSKGYMTLESGAFRPNDPLNRYEFTSALVGMFFALERGLSCTFPDVETDSPYYDYVASAQARSLVEGFEDGTFGGEKNITVEQMAAIAARTLMDQKGYALPEDAESYLSSYSDNADIANWAREQVALSVREGILDRGGELLPKENVTRDQAAVILYRLFLLLYEVPPVALELPPVTSEEDPGSAEQLPVAIIVAGGVATVAAAGGGVVYLVLKKRKIKTQ